MKRYLPYIRTFGAAVVIIAIGALAGWYYFLRGAENAANQNYAAAGYGAIAPTFEGSTGSTYQNVISTLGAEGVSVGSSTSRLWEVSAVPVAGFGWVSTSSPALYFVERSSGYVFEADTNDRNITRLTDTLRPKIYQALITENAGIVERSIDTSGALITFAGTVASSSNAALTSTSSPDELQGNDLPPNILAIAADPVSSALYYLIQSPSGMSLVSTNVKGTGEKNLFSSSITGWHIFAPGDGSVALLQSPLDGVEGYAYKLQGNSLSLIAQEPGLTILPHPYSSALIFGSSSGGTLSLFARASASSTPVQLSLATVADKCAWAPGGSLIAYCGVPQSVPSQQFLDDWYKGLVHTSDAFYTVDASAGTSALLYNPTGDTNVQLDADDVSVDPTGQYIAFINAADQSLWVIRVAQ